MRDNEEKVKRLSSIIGFLVNARTLRREMCLPCIDLTLRIRWNLFLLKSLESPRHG